MKIIHAILILTSMTAAIAMSGEKPKAETVVKSYRKELVKMMPTPHLVNAELFTACRTLDTRENLEQEYGPHFKTSVNIYVTKEAKAMFLAEKSDFPEGTIIVKEKNVPFSGNAEKRDPAHLVGIGGMIKRDADYDPKNGNWEYFYSDKEGKLTSGKMESCIDCHQNAKQTDYIFASWLKPLLEVKNSNRVEKKNP